MPQETSLSHYVSMPQVTSLLFPCAISIYSHIYVSLSQKQTHNSSCKTFHNFRENGRYTWNSFHGNKVPHICIRNYDVSSYL